MPDGLVRVRLAPSPTGFIHLGTCRTALFNFLFARHQRGTFVLRLDDTDTERDLPEYEATIYETLRWLGLDWDEGPEVGGPHGPYRQSERMDIYRRAAARLLESGAAYRCYCTPAELEAERELARREGRPYRYGRRCLTDRPPDWQTRPFAVRFRVPEGETVIEDMVRGTMRWDHALIGDFIIVRSDSRPLYNFTSPVDDALMSITHVLRAEEHLPNTPGQLMILEALGYERPRAFAHLPWILGPDGNKLSKRKHPEMNMALYRERGYLPEAMVNYMALLGWNPGTEQEAFTLDELIAAFDIARVQAGGAIFDWKKLDWVTGQYIRGLSDDELARRLRQYLPELPPETIERAAPALKERLNPLAQARELLDYLWTDPAAPELDEDDRARLRVARELLADCAWDPSAIEAALDRALARLSASKNQLYRPIRLAVTGKTVSPPIQHTLALLPKATALARLDRVLDHR